MPRIDRLSTQLWLLSGLTGSCPAELRLKNGRISLKILDMGAMAPRHLRKIERVSGVTDLEEKLARGEKVQLFDVTVRELSAIFPWYFFHAGCTARANGFAYRLSFVRPQNTIVREPGNLSDAADAANGIMHASRLGRRWRKAITAYRGEPLVG